jgi:hypothetical protein
VSYPLAFPPARGGPQPLVSLSYSHTGGMSEVGQGWSLGLPVIERKGLAGGPPTFAATDSYHLSGQILLYLCTVSGTTCSASNSGPMPHWATGWQLYRPAVDSSYTRVFRSPPNSADDSSTWRLQKASGEILEFGVSTIAPEGPQRDLRGFAMLLLARGASLFED